MPTGIIDSLLPAIDSILGVRDSAGAVVAPVYFVTRTWSGTQIGEGTAHDTQVQMLPSPAIKNFSQDIRLREGGSVQSGDVILKYISKNKYRRRDLDGFGAAANVEKLYLVGVKLYQVINIAEDYVTWDVQVRELTNQTRY